MIRLLVTISLVLVALVGSATAGSSNNPYDLRDGAAFTPEPIGQPVVVPRDAGVVYLDAETPDTGSLLDVQVLETPYGPISSPAVEISDVSDPDVEDAGGFGQCFDIINEPGSYAIIEFGFDVEEIIFVYGGNIGSILVEARDIDGNVVDSFFQASTDDGMPAGPETVQGSGIRSLYWEDPGMNYAILDNLVVVVEGGVATEASTWTRIKGMLR